MANILDFAVYKKFKLESGGLVTKRLPYVDKGSNACLMIDGESYGFINQLTQSPTQNVFFDMEPKDIATLQPMIRLYKVNTDKETGDETEIEMNFSSNATYQEIKSAFDDSGRRGVGVGIKEFNFTYDGSTPFAAKKSIKAKLTLVANNFDELLKPRGRSSKKYRYIDLALKTGTKTGAQTELQEANLSKLNFRLKALVGWALPPGELEHFGGWRKKNGEVIKKRELIRAIYDSFVTLNLTPTIHEFGIDETGRTTLTINYLAYVDDFYDQPTFNIFSDQNAALTLLTRDLRYKKVMQSPNCNAADIAEMKKEDGYADVVKEARQINMRSLARQLMKKNLIRYMSVPFEEQLSFLEKGPFYNRATGLYEQIALNVPETATKDMLDDLGMATGPDEVELAEKELEEAKALLRQTEAAAHRDIGGSMQDAVSDAQAAVSEAEEALGKARWQPTAAESDAVGASTVADLVSTEPEPWTGGDANTVATGEQTAADIASAAIEAQLPGFVDVDATEAAEAYAADASLYGTYDAGEELTQNQADELVADVMPDADKALEEEEKSGTGVQEMGEIPRKIVNLNTYNIAFFFVSDLIDLILEGIDDYLRDMPSKITGEGSPVIEQIANDKIDMDDVAAEIARINKFRVQFEKFRVLLGPLELVSPKDDVASVFVNFGDVPVSLKYFMEWLTDKLVRKEKSIYTLSKFLSDFFNHLVSGFLNDNTCFGYSIKQKTRVNQAAITSYKSSKNKNDEVTQWIVDNRVHAGIARGMINPGAGGMPQPILNISGKDRHPEVNPGPSQEINYMVFFAGRTQPSDIMKGSRTADESRGIFHYMLGKDRGIVKKIDLTRTDAKFLREVRFEQEGYNGLEQLREVYDVDIETYANVKTFPGTYIYVNPKGWAPNTDFDLTRLGIGGYCMIIRSEHSFGAGKANSKITAKWVASIGANEKSEFPDSGRGANTDTQKCRANRSTEAKRTDWWSGKVAGVLEAMGLGGANPEVAEGDGTDDTPPTPTD